MTTEINLSALTADQLEALLEQKRKEEASEREAKRSAYEQLREETVQQLFAKAKGINKALTTFKDKAFADMQALHACLIEHSKRHSEGKGNFEVQSEDGKLKIAYKYQENGRFDERSKEAEAHIIDFVARHFKEQPDSQELITKLLERNKGQLDIKLVQKLYGMEDRFSDTAWREGIRLLKESFIPTDTKTYINFYERDGNGTWVALPLNFSAV
jgi:hypothetical protein